MQAQQELRELLTTSEGQAALMAWLGSTMTQLQIRAARERAAPFGLQPGEDAVMAAYRLGVSVGGNQQIDAMTMPVSARSRLGTEVHPLVPTYGADVILKEGE